MATKKSRKSVAGKAKSAPGVAALAADFEQTFPIVAVGASAGGLEVFTDFLREIPPDTGMGFVLIQHLDPKHHSLLTQLLGRETKMPAVEVKDGMVVEPNRVYVIPPNANMTVSSRVLRLSPREGSSIQHMPVDYFMRSLAQDQGDKALGVILSGTGTDGTLGLAEIQAQGGVTFAQEPASAKYDGMPRSAINSGCVDFVLPPREIAREVARMSRHPYVSHIKATGMAELVPETEPSLKTILNLLRKTSGVDFTYYRHTTIRRRIQRRMVVHKIDKLKDYVGYLIQHAAEVKALYQDVLINVTSFFRNPHVFEAIKKTVFPAMLKDRGAESSVRVWVPGCASGEEAYSLAILMLESLGDRASHTPIQIFGTDVSEFAIAKARAGVFPENIQADVSLDRLRRFFVKTEGGFAISKTIRDMCIFAQHNLLADPPFSQMDLVSCRNLLIYLEPVLQKRVGSLLHYALKPKGTLVLGTSEGLGASAHLFEAVDKEHKIYTKRWSAERPAVAFSVHRAPSETVVLAAGGGTGGKLDYRTNEPGWSQLDAQKELDRRLLTSFVPAAVVLDDNLEIIHTRGATDRYLKLSPGKASLNLMRMAREGLIFDLRNAIRTCQKENAPVRREGLQIRRNGDTVEINFEVIPIKTDSGKSRHYMVVFSDRPPMRAPAEGGAGRVSKATLDDLKAAKHRVSKLEDELSANKDYLHSVIQDLEATNEEMQSANEEVISSNEELQSTNEELETSKEELQSTNEELNTVNEELRSRNLEVNQVNNDLMNLLHSVNIAIVMLGSDLSIRRYTPLAEKLIGLIPSDIGRPITNINPTVEMPELHQTIVQVIETLRVHEREVQDRGGKWYRLRVLPYRTHDNKIDGVVMTLVDIDDLKTQVNRIQELVGTLEIERDRQKAILDQIPAAVLIAEAPSGKLLQANQQLEKIFGRPYRATRDLEEFNDYYPVQDSNGRPLGVAKRPLARALLKGETITAEEMYVEVGGNRRIVQSSCAPVRDKEGAIVGAVSVVSDVTDRRRAERALVEMLERDLKETHWFAEALIETAREPLLVVDENLIVNNANPAFYKTFQLTREATENKPVHELGKGEWGSAKFRQMLQDVLHKNARLDDFEIEEEFGGIGRRTLLVNGRGLELTPQRHWVLLSIQDVTEHRRAHDLAQERSELLDLAHDAIIIRGLDGTILAWNRGAEELYGWTAQEVLGKKTTEVITTQFPVPAGEVMRRLKSEGNWQGELVHRTKSGGSVNVTSRWAFKRNEHNVPGAILEINRDVTSEKRALSEVEELSRWLLQSQDHERRRMARELHDTTGQKIAALSMNLELISKSAGKLPHENQKHLGETRRLVEQISEEIRTLAYLLHPPLLDELGLGPAIKWLVDGLARRSKVKVDAEVPEDLSRMPEDVEITLFRVLQEALTNVHLHSGAASAKVIVERKGDQIALEVQDDGTEFRVEGQSDGAKPRLGVGVAGMRERVEQLGGTFEISSSLKGTRVRATVPLAQG